MLLSPEKQRLLRAIALPWVVLSALTIASAVLITKEVEKDTLDTVTLQGRDIAQLVKAMRRWNYLHGPIYVPENDQTPPNPYLPEAERALNTQDGRRLIRIDSAYMTRQLAGVVRDETDIRIHLTSLRPLNPYNAPHPWEIPHLEAFEAGQRNEALELKKNETPPLARYIFPLRVDPSCVQCHQSQNVRLGEVLGGLSVDWPIAGLLHIEKVRKERILFLHVLGWILINVMLIVGFRRTLRDLSRLKSAHDELHASNSLLGDEILRRRNAESVEQFRNATLTAINDGKPLGSVLDTIVAAVEQLLPGTRGAILPLNAEKTSLASATAPNLPGFFTSRLTGTPLSPTALSCASAAYAGAPAFDNDISASSAWSELQESAERAGIHACWSFPVFDSSGQASGVLALFHAHAQIPSPDQRRIAEQFAQLAGIALEHSEHKAQLLLAASVFTSAHEAIVITSPAAVILDVNARFTSLTGYSRQEAIGQTPRLLKSGLHDKEFYDQLWHQLMHSGYWEGEIWNRKKNGELMPESLRISAVVGEGGTITHFVALFSDITLAKAHEQQLKKLAHFDPLTALPNRTLFSDRLDQAMRQAERRQQTIAIVFIDLDGFKAVNDRYGHNTGDHLLVALSQAMRNGLRESDTLARIGGDEFVAVLLDLDSADSSLPLITRLLETASQPFEIDEVTLHVSASIGVTFFPQHDDVDADQLLRQADHAMYQAKQTGKNRYHCFDLEHDRIIRGHHTNLESIRQAFVSEQFILVYQPKVNMRTGCIIGVEALIRWQHPQRGLLPPASFLPAIENDALSAEIGDWVIGEALRQMTKWRTDGLRIPVSINVGAYQLQHGNFLESLKTQLAKYPDIPPADLCIEILETSALDDLLRVASIILECRQIGITFSLDDFGTGYSSLTYLKRLDVDELKIDKSFVHDILSDPDDLSILAGILGLSRSLSRQVIAEGVETEAHGVLLLQMGCELAQGYGISRPMCAEDIPNWAANWRPPASWSGQPTRPSTEYPLLVALVEHRAWFSAVSEHLSGLRANLPLTHHMWRLSRWIETEGREQYGDHPYFSEVERLEREIHTRADELSRLHLSGQSTEANAGLTELHALSTALQDKLSALSRE